MGFAIYLQDENGVVKASVFDPENLLHRQLTMMNKGLLGGIDWYGNTVFNRLQMRQFIPEWEALLVKATSSEEEALLKKVLELAKVSLNSVHQYLKFDGD